jgi:hypothetical protein
VLDLTVRLTDISLPSLNSASWPDQTGALLTCDRCHEVEEIVVAIMEILPLKQSWALCGPCKQELPNGFHRA